MKYYILISLLILTTLCSWGQSRRIENIVTLRNELSHISDLKAKAKKLNLLVRSWIQYNLDSAVVYSHQAQEFIEQQHITSEYGPLYLNLSEIALQTSTDSIAFYYIQKAEDAFEKSGDQEKYVDAACVMADILVSKRDFETANQLLLFALKFTQKHQLVAGQAYVYFVLGKSAHQSYSFVQAEKYYKQSMDLHQKLKNINPASLYSELGNLYYHQGRFNQAIEIYQLAIPHVLQHEDLAGVGYIFGNIGLAELALGRYEDALISLKKSLEARKKTNYDLGLMVSYTDISKVYLHLGNISSVSSNLHQAMELSRSSYIGIETANLYAQKARLHMVESKWDSAQVYLHKSLAICQSRNYAQGMLEVYLDLMKISISMNNEQNIESYYEDAKNIAQQLQNEYYSSKLDYLMALDNFNKGDYQKASELIQTNLLPFQVAPDLVINSFTLMMECYQALNNTERTEWCQKKLNAIRDSIMILSLSPTLAHTIDTHQLQDLSSELNSNTLQLSVMQKWLTGTGIAYGLLIFLMLRICQDSKEKSARLLKKKRKLEQLRIEENTLRDEIEEERKIRIRETRELVGMIRSKDNMLYELRQKILENYHERAQTIRNELKRMLHSIQNQLTSDDTFLQEIIRMEEDFLKRLEYTYPDLTAVEQRLSIYVKMNFTDKEIALFLNVPLREVEVNKCQLKEHLGLNPEEDLKKLINKI